MFYYKQSPWIIRRVEGEENSIFLTFDDGPDPESTPPILNLLRAHGVRTSFFVIGEKARQHPDLIERMYAEGHSVHSHSLDHRYDVYFKNKALLKDWICESLTALTVQTGQKHSCFRPPAGVITPPLVEASRELKVPLILWNHRFFDTTLPWTPRKALANAGSVTSGDIVLLHDQQKQVRLPAFLTTLEIYLAALQQRGFRLRALSETGLV